ncbi:MAG: pilus assembly protein PilM [Phycisphaerales bacterium]|nr:pilus assembly protein PilM [Phycisphaerales bacterium]
MSLPRPGSLSPIGVDVGTSWIKAAQVSRSRRGWRLHACAAFPRLQAGGTASADEFQRLAQVLDRAGFEDEQVVVGAPREALHTAVLDLPPRASGAPIEQICEAEMVRMFRLPADAFEMFAWEMPSDSPRIKSTQMLASAVVCQDAEDFIGRCESAGLRVLAIDLAAEATARACRAQCAASDELTVLLDVGASGVDMLVFREGACIYQRWLEGAGTGAITAALSSRLEISTEIGELLLRRMGLYPFPEGEVDPVLAAGAAQIFRQHSESLLGAALTSASYATDRFPGESVGAIRLAGAGAGMPGLAEFLAEISGLAVEVVVPKAWGRVTCPGAGPALMTAIGHAMWGRG